MFRSRVVAFALLAAVAAAPALAARRVRVESVDGGYRYVAVSTSGGVRLVRQLSRAECVFGETWGYDRSGIWADQGCRAEFEVGPESWSSGPTSAGRSVRVESKDGQYRYRRTDTRGGVVLRRQLSGASCRLGESWGFDGNGIWVDKGCRGEFEVGARPSAGGGWGGGSGLPTVRIESRDGQRAYRRVDTGAGVRLKRQLSSADCRQGRTWGFDPDGIWVDRGCRAEFELGGGPSVSGSYTRVRLESKDGARVEQRVDARGGVVLLRQLSRADCILGRTWGYGPEAIWVDQGCRAEFAVH
jgi:hypothetical protein